MKIVKLPEDSRPWFYFPIEMPLVKGNGPTSFKDWDKNLNSYGVHLTIYDAINQATQLNKELYNES